MKKLFKYLGLAVGLALIITALAIAQAPLPAASKNLGPAVTQFSFMTSHFADSVHYVFSRNTAPGRLVGYNVFTGEVTLQISIELNGDRSTEAFSMTSHNGYLYIAANFESDDRRLSLIKVDPKTGAYTEAAPLYPARMARGMALSPDGKILLAMSQQDNARVYEFDPVDETVTEIGSFETQPRQAANAVAATEDYIFVGVGIEAPNLWAYNRHTQERVSILPEELKYLTGIEALALHGNWLIAGGSGSKNKPVIALISLQDFSDYRLINHNHDLVQAIAVGGDNVYFGSGEGVWKYNIVAENMARISGLKSNRGLFYYDEVLYGTDGRREIGSYNLNTGQTRRMDMAETGAQEWPEPGQSMISVNNKVYVAGHHALGIHNPQTGHYKNLQTSGEAKQMAVDDEGNIYLAMYSSGTLVRFNPVQESFHTVATAPDQNNRPRSIAYDAHNKLVLMGTQADNRGSGALTIYDKQKNSVSWISKPFADQAVGAVTAHEGIAYLGGYQGRLDPGTDARLAAWNAVTKEKLWEITPVPRQPGISSLLVVDGRLWGITSAGRFFVVDLQTREVVHSKEIFPRWEETGRLVRKNNLILAVNVNAVARINPDNYEDEIMIENLASRWFHWPDAAIDDNGNVYVLGDSDLLQFEIGEAVNIEKPSALPAEFVVSQNYPNPFNPATTVQYQLPRQAEVRIQVYAITGQLVHEQPAEIKTAGTHQFNFDASRLTSGIYVIRVSAGTQTKTVQATLIK